uniref:Putative secreted protein n=1 Tax=Anopheles darlingi TaxID=43151 RepID=A0A2M4DD87_ANODA
MVCPVLCAVGLCAWMCEGSTDMSEEVNKPPARPPVVVYPSLLRSAHTHIYTLHHIHPLEAILRNTKQQ